MMKFTTISAAIPVTQSLSTATTYAQLQNDKYKTVIDDYVTIPNRVNELTSRRPELIELFKEFAAEFRSRFMFSTYAEMTRAMVGMGEVSMYKPILECDINATMQRDPDGDHIVDLLGNCDPMLVNAIRAYCDPTRTDGGGKRFIAWDGQHTVMLLYIIAVYGFGMDPADVRVPVVVYPGHDRAAIRRQFVYYNSGAGSKTLDAIDLFMQYVYGYNNDGNRSDMNVRCYQIQQLAEKYNLFLTHEKFGNADKAGAISRLSEIMNPNYSVDVIEKVFYYHSIAAKLISNPVYALEIDNLATYFRACSSQGIVVTSSYVDGMAKIFSSVTNNTWNVGSKKHNKVIVAYKNWFTKAQKRGMFQPGERPRCNQTEVGPAWLGQVITYHSKGAILAPTFTNYNFLVKDLV
jgi:hypothetical protein